MLFIEEHVHNSEIIVFEKDLGKEWKLKEEHVPRHYELLERALKDLTKSTAKSQLYKVYNSKDFRISSQGKLESLNLITVILLFIVQSKNSYRGCGMLQTTNLSTISGFLMAKENPTAPPQSCTTSVHFS